MTAEIDASAVVPKFWFWLQRRRDRMIAEILPPPNP
jgi:hypothetical protein